MATVILNKEETFSLSTCLFILNCISDKCKEISGGWKTNLIRIIGEYEVPKVQEILLKKVKW